MADLVVKDDLKNLVADLDELISQFKDADDFQDDCKGLWGQRNANLSMGDFADNWKIHRKKIVKEMEGLRDKVQKVEEAWEETDRRLLESLVDG